jgi:antitoxin HicB
MGDGKTEAAAIEDARAAIASWVEAAEKFGDPVPEPGRLEDYSGKFVTRIPRSLHMTLVEMARREGVSLNQFVLTKLAEAAGEKQAKA